MNWTNGGWQGITQFDGFKYMDMQLEKTFLNDRLSLTLHCMDVFNTHVFNGKINFDNIDQTFKINHNNRLTLLVCRYRFGSQQIGAARTRDAGIKDEMGRTKKN